MTEGWQGPILGVSFREVSVKRVDYISFENEQRGCTEQRIRPYLLLSHAYSEVGLVELIRNVPAQRTELASLLNECVKETQAEQQFLPNLQGSHKNNMLV